jgi:hypothetical protein
MVRPRTAFRPSGGACRPWGVAVTAGTSPKLSGQICGQALPERLEGCGPVVDDRGGHPRAGARMLPCGDIHPSVGITSTPVIDAGLSEVFVVADGLVGTIEGGAHGVLHGLDPATSHPVVPFSLGKVVDHLPTPSVGDGLLLAPAANRVDAFSLAA